MPPNPQQILQGLIALGYDPNHLYQELEMESRFVDAHLDISHAYAPLYLHSHNFYELLCCVNACGVDYLVGTDRYRLQKGDILLIPPGFSHRPLLPAKMPEPYIRHVLWISSELMENLCAMVPEFRKAETVGNLMLRTAGTSWEHLSELFQKCTQESEKRGPNWELAMVGNTITLLVGLHRAYLDSVSDTLRAEKPELLERLLAYIEEHLQEKITLVETARIFFVSESTITQLFRRTMGVSFYRYITQRRLIGAKTYIEQGMLLEDVALRTGFGDYSAFYRAFKQAFGISPRQYRSLQESNARNPL